MWPRCHKAQISGVEFCTDGDASCLHTQPLNLSLSDHQVLGPLSYQCPSPPVVQFGQAGSRESLGWSKLL